MPYPNFPFWNENRANKEPVKVIQSFASLRPWQDPDLLLISDLRKEKYPGDFPNKIIVVLQKFKNNMIWNVTCLTTTLKILNVKFDAKGGNVLEDKIENVFSLKAS